MTDRYDGKNLRFNTTNTIIESNVTTIGKHAFYGCTSLTTITIPTSVIIIESAAFRNCRSLTAITLPPSITTIGEFAFCDCNSLSTIAIPSCVTCIESYTFARCTSLTSVTLPPYLTIIERLAFVECNSLTNVTLPATLRLIGYNAFQKCPNLKCIELSSSLPFIIIKREINRDTGNTYGYPKDDEKLATLYDVLMNKDTTTTYYAPISQELHKLLEVVTEKYYNRNHLSWNKDDIIVDWSLYSSMKNEQGRLPLFTALNRGLKWSDGLNTILKGNGGAIEDVDVTTGLEAFMYSAVGTNSNLETVFKLLQDHPAAINPYVVPVGQHPISDRKRKLSEL